MWSLWLLASCVDCTNVSISTLCFATSWLISRVGGRLPGHSLRRELEDVTQAHRVVTLCGLSKNQPIKLETVPPVDVLADLVVALVVEARLRRQLLGGHVHAHPEDLLQRRRIRLGAYGLLVGHNLGLQQRAELEQFVQALNLVAVHLRHRDELIVEVEFIILGDGVDDVTDLPVHLEAVLSFNA